MPFSTGACQSTPPPASLHEPSAWMIFFDDGSVELAFQRRQPAEATEAACNR